ncbi:oligosaccharide flippase family protein [Nanoarchaeota archaeon]
MKQNVYYKKIARNSIFLLLSTLIGNLFLFLFNVVIAHLLGAEKLGIILLVSSVLLIFTLIADIGIPFATTKMIAEYYVKNKLKQIKSTVVSSLKLIILFSIISTVILLFASNYISNVILHENITYFLQIFSITIILGMLIRYANSLFHGFQDMKYSFFTNVIQQFFSFLITVILVITGYGVFGALLGRVIGFALAVIIGTIFSIFILKKYKITSKTSTWNGNRILSYGILMYLPFLSIFIIPSLLNIIIGGYLYAKDVALFGVSFSLVSLSFLILIPLSNVLLPTFSELNAKKDKLIKTLSTLALKYIGIISYTVAFIFVYFSAFILKIIYGNEFIDASLIVVMLAFAVFLESFKVVTDPLLNGTNLAKYVTIAETIKFIIIFGLGILFVKYYGIIGGAYAVLIAFFVSITLKLLFVNIKLKISLIDSKLINYLFLISLLAVFFILNIPVWWTLLASIIIIILTKCVSIKEIKQILKIIFQNK